MPTIDSDLSPLSAIRTKIRRLTRSPSTAQLSTAAIDDYVNTFVLYDFPEFTVDKQLTFYTYPYIDTYATNDELPDDSPFNNFKNVYLSVQPPVYIAGRESAFTQSRNQFFNQYPKTQTEETVGTGDGATVLYQGNLSSLPVLANSVSFTAAGQNGTPMVIKEYPRIDPEGIQTQVGTLYSDEYGLAGSINYLTGLFRVAFPDFVAVGQPVIAQAYAYRATFTFRPVPDKSYRIDIDAFQRPTALLDAVDEPDIAQWWQYIAYGASKKIFEDRMDVESVKAIAPEFFRQRSLVMQRLVVQQSSERTATIYTEKGVGSYGGENTF